MIFKLKKFVECAIKAFLNFYRDHFPGSSVTPKMHFLEDHIIPWIRRWKVGLVFRGEQGAESIHAQFNRLKIECLHQ